MWGYIFVGPAILGFLLWTVGPMLASLVLGFTHWDMLSAPQWVGAENYRQMFTGADPLFWQTVKVTAVYTLLVTPLVAVFFSLGLALLLNRRMPGIGIMRTIFYLPNVVPLVANAVLWLALFNPTWGMLNQFIGLFGIPPQPWIYSENGVIPSLVLMATWTSSGASMVIYLAGLQGIPQELYEAVAIDGGGAWTRFRHVALPLITPLILFNVVLTFIWSVQVFVQPYIMTNGGPANASLFYMMYVYRVAFQDGDMGYACALAWFLFMCVAIVSVVVFSTSRWWVYYESEGRS